MCGMLGLRCDAVPLSYLVYGISLSDFITLDVCLSSNVPVMIRCDMYDFMMCMWCPVVVFIKSHFCECLFIVMSETE